MPRRFVSPVQAEYDGSGDPLSGAKLYFYAEGTATPQDTYSDTALTVANANPVVADSAGRFGDIFLSALGYKVVLKDSSDVEIWSKDNYRGGEGSPFKILSKTAAYTATAADRGALILVDASGGAVTITQTAAATVGDDYEISVKKTDSSTNLVTFGSVAMGVQNQAVTMRSDGSAYQILGRYTPFAGFSAYLAASTTNDKTGDATDFTITGLTEVFDEGGGLNATTGVFTAPVTGKYRLDATVIAANLAAGHTKGFVKITTTNRTYFSDIINVGAARDSGNTLTLKAGALADMTAGHTATFVLNVSGSTKTVGVFGAANPNTYVSGYLVSH